MNLLKRENGFLWIIITLATSGASGIIFCSLLGLYNENAWYANKKNWLLGLICLVYPFIVMVMVFTIQSLCLANAKLDVPGKDIYLTPYIWLLALIIPVVGWLFFICLLFYLMIAPIVAIYHGKGEKLA